MARTRTEAKRRQILEAAAKVFSSHGYHPATVAQIADEVGMGLGTFYRYFENKLGVFKAVVDEVLVQVSQALASESPTSSQTLAEYRAQVRRIGELLFAAFTSNRSLARLLFVEAPGIDVELNTTLREATLLFGAMTQAWLDHGLSRGYLRDDLDAQTTALAINAMIFEGVRHISDALPDQVEAVQRQWSNAIVALMFDGVRR